MCILHSPLEWSYLKERCGYIFKIETTYMYCVNRIMIRSLRVNTMYLIKREDDFVLESRSNFQEIQHILKKSG